MPEIPGAKRYPQDIRAPQEVARAPHADPPEDPVAPPTGSVATPSYRREEQRSSLCAQHTHTPRGARSTADAVRIACA
jgi:hypothetical protein